MRIRSKLIVLILVPLLAVALVAAIGFVNQSASLERAEDASETVAETQAVHDAILAIGAERLLRLGGDIGAPGDIADAVDSTLALASDQERTEGTRQAAEQAEALVARSRLTTDRPALGLLGEAADLLLAIDLDQASDYLSAEARNAAVVNRSAIEYLQFREWAWIAYLGTTEPTPQARAGLTSDFAVANSVLATTLFLSLIHI